MYSVEDVSKFIIDYCDIHKISLNNLKLQKILYFVQAEFLVRFNTNCFNTDIEAWDFGPVVPKIFRIFKMYGNCNIYKSSIKSIDSNEINESDKEILIAIIKECNKYSNSDLTNIIHNQTPWIRGFLSHNKIIKSSEMKSFFSEN